MKILCVCQYFWPESFRVNDLCQGLIKKGHEVTVLTGIPNYPEGRFYDGYGVLKRTRQIWNSIHIIRTPLFPRLRGAAKDLVLNYLSFMISGCVTAFLFVQKKAKFDVIFVYQLSPITMALPAILLKKILGVPMVLYVLDLWPDSVRATNALNNKWMMKLLEKMSMYIYGQCDMILVSSKGFMNELQARGISQQRLEYFPQWAEDSYQTQEVAVDENFEFSTDNFYLVFAGNIGVLQGFETIIKAALLLKDYKRINWVILGNGRRKDWLQNQVIDYELQTNFHLLGRKPVESMPFYFSKADVLLVSLVNDPIINLTLPAKIQSYLASGKPIVGALGGESAAVIEESGSGYSCNPGDANALAACILKLYNMNDEERKNMGLRGKQYCTKNFSREKLLNQLEMCFQEKVT